ncbi:hypothetical protein Tco_0351672 [Tanacetum coccineum]
MPKLKYKDNNASGVLYAAKLLWLYYVSDSYYDLPPIQWVVQEAVDVYIDEIGNESYEEQRLKTLEYEREARIQRAKEQAEEHWEEVAALKKYEVLYDYQTKYDSDDGYFECYSYDNLHLAYFAEKSF